MEFAGVVDLIDKAWKIGGDVFEGFVIHQIDGLDLKGLHEAFGLGIVIGIATSAHRADETMFGQQVAIGLGGVLRLSVSALGQSASGSIDADDHVRLEVLLPWFLAKLVGTIQPLIRKEGTLLLEKK